MTRECYFGKSCIGKTTYLGRLGVDAVDCDVLFRESMDERYGFERSARLRILNRDRFIAYVNLFRNGMATDASMEQFVKRAKWTAGRILDRCFWEIFFTKSENRTLDFAAAGFYYDVIPKDFLTNVEFVELKSGDFEYRVRNAEARRYDRYVLMALDSMYERPKTAFHEIELKKPVA